MANIPTAEEVSKHSNLQGKVAIVTGANAGIGKETARVLALRNCHVILACRSVDSGKQARDEILHSIGNDKAHLLEVESLDLGLHASIHAFAERFGKRSNKDLHILINNAGLAQGSKEDLELLTNPSATPKSSKNLTPDGLEITIGVNHVGTFLLTILLLPFLKASAPSRIIVVASDAHLQITNPDVADLNLDKLIPFHPQYAYAVSKLFNILFVKELAKRLNGTGISANSLHPGLVPTNIFKGSKEENLEVVNKMSQTYNVPVLSVEQGAATSVYLAVSEDGSKSGGYYHGTEPFYQSAAAQDEQLAKLLWENTEKVAKVSFPTL